MLASKEGFGIDGVELPRQKLEEFFLQIVERARAEQAATSGAAGGGPTAKFLMGEGPSEGEALIEGLVRGEPAKPAAAVKAPTASVAAPAKESVLEELLQPERPAPSAKPSAKAPRRPRASTRR